MAAIIDGAAGLRWVMYGAKVLPFGRAHFRARDGRAWWSVREEGNNDRVDLLSEKSAQFIEPQCLVHVLWWLCEPNGHVLVHSNHAIGTYWMCEEVMQSFEVFGELKS